MLFVLIAGGVFYFDKSKKNEIPNPYANSTITVATFRNADSTFGYDISIDGNSYVYQPTKPAVGGNAGFATEEDAKKVGEFVIKKIRNNIIPPSVTPEELKELGVI